MNNKILPTNVKINKRTKNGYTNFHIFRENRILKIKQNGLTCERCGKVEKRIHVHHRDLSKNNHELYNLICVCSQCHRDLHKGHWICSYDGCLNIHYALGLCQYHWNRFKKKEKQDNRPWENKLEGEAQYIFDCAFLKLSDRQRLVINLRFYENYTLDQIADKLKCSRERVRQIESKSLRIMENSIKKINLDNFGISPIIKI